MHFGTPSKTDVSPYLLPCSSYERFCVLFRAGGGGGWELCKNKENTNEDAIGSKIKLTIYKGCGLHKFTNNLRVKWWGHGILRHGMQKGLTRGGGGG